MGVTCLKVQVLLHDLPQECGAIQYLNHKTSGKVNSGHHVPEELLQAVPDSWQVVRPTLKRGTVIFYSPLAMHSGGSNACLDHKVVLYESM